jgi:hypothetical protein
MQYQASVTGHPHVKIVRHDDSPYLALQSLFTGLMEYSHDDAMRCADFWTRDEVAGDIALIGRVEGYCGPFAWRCEATS